LYLAKFAPDGHIFNPFREGPNKKATRTVTDGFVRDDFPVENQEAI
jgi:hypothetical protein